MIYVGRPGVFLESTDKKKYGKVLEIMKILKKLQRFS